MSSDDHIDGDRAVFAGRFVEDAAGDVASSGSFFDALAKDDRSACSSESGDGMDSLHSSSSSPHHRPSNSTSSGYIPREFDDRVHRFCQSIEGFSTFLHSSGMECYFPKLLGQLHQLSSAIEERRDDITTFYSFLERHGLPSQAASAGYYCILPNELVVKILSYLSAEELVYVARVSTQWKRLSEDEALWRGLYRTHFIHSSDGGMSSVSLSLDDGSHMSPASARRVSGLELSRLVHRNTSRFSRAAEHGITHWKDYFIRRSQTERKWNNGEYTVKTFSGQTNTRVRCMQFDEEKLILGSFDQKAIRILDFLTRRPLAELKGHYEGVMALRFEKSNLLSASRDKSLKLWDMESCRALRTLSDHDAAVWCLDWDGGPNAVSGSEDRSINWWDLRAPEKIHSFTGHTKGVGSIVAGDRLVASGSRDKTIRVWDLRQRRCLHVLSGHANSVRCVQFDDRRVVSGSWDNTIKVWDLATGCNTGTLIGHTDRVLSLQFDREKLVSGSFDTTVKIWDMQSLEVKHTLEGHSYPLAHVQFDENCIVSASRDLTIKVWDFSVAQPSSS